MGVLSTRVSRKGPKEFLKNCFLKKVCENTYVGAAVKIGIVDLGDDDDDRMVDSAILKNM